MNNMTKGIKGNHGKVDITIKGGKPTPLGVGWIA